MPELTREFEVSEFGIATPADPDNLVYPLYPFLHLVLDDAG
jgi:hypothetical protein